MELAELDAGLPKEERLRRIAEESGDSVRTIRRWALAVKHLPDMRDWAPALARSHSGGRARAEVAPEVWDRITYEWLNQSQPALSTVYRIAKKFAAKEGHEMPSYATIKRRIGDLPRTAVVWWREGEKAYERLFPAMQRDYSTLELHQVWCSDGRKADVFCRWPDDTVGRPILMAWQELRTRKILGWEVGKVEDAELVRLSFRDAAKRSGALPTEAYIDNGRAYASKQITGGQATRNRFKINPEDPFGLLTIFSVKAVWTTPYRGQSKPIESYWNTIAQGEKCTEFAGAYCGNRPDAKPEEFDVRKAVPLAAYLSFVAEAVAEKNAREHRGDSMYGRSPDDLYDELWNAGAPVRHPTAEQLRQCLKAVELVTLDEAGGVTVMGNRYWSEQLAALPRRGQYVARFNPNDASEPVSIFDGEQFIADAPLFARTGFRDMDAAKDHNRERRRMLRAEKDRAKAIVGQQRAADSWTLPRQPEDASQVETMPSPKVARMVNPQSVRKPHAVATGKRAADLTPEDAAHQAWQADRDRGLELRLEEERKRRAAA